MYTGQLDDGVRLTLENTVPYATDMPGTLLRNGFAHLPMSEDGTMTLGSPGVGVPGVSHSFLYFGSFIDYETLCINFNRDCLCALCSSF